jgi:gamma-glutamyl-gamma-aminobutyrate hydrolase PuuD
MRTLIPNANCSSRLGYSRGVEAMERPGARWCLGVQWHPELLPDDPRELGLFTEFVLTGQKEHSS